jgi:hypothetical protein
MSVDTGMMARIEQWFVQQLLTLQYNNEQFLKEVDHWRHQIGLDKSGIESFDSLAPFAFVKWEPSMPGREGDYDLNRKIYIAVAIGQTSKAAGNARIGTATKPGISWMHTNIINLFEGQHPGDGFTCDDFYYYDEAENVDHPKRCGITLYFVANYLTS